MKNICIAMLAISAFSGAANAGEIETVGGYLPGEVFCMAENVFHEARGESKLGQKMVVEVTLNRVESKRWPNTICEVVYQPYQFSWTLDLESADNAMLYKEFPLFVEILNSVKLWLREAGFNTTGADHYATLDTNRTWMDKMDLIAEVGGHKFFSSN